MRILHFPSNTGNHPRGVMKAERDLGHDSELVLVTPNRFYPEIDSLAAADAPTWRRWLERLRFARKAVNDYDAFHFNKGETFLPGSLPFAFDLWWLRRRGKTTSVTFQGSDARPHIQGAPKTNGLPVKVTDWIKRVRIAQITRWADSTFCLNPDLLKHVPGSTFAPYLSVDLDKLQPSPKKPLDGRSLRVVHAPTNRKLKGTQAVIAAIEIASQQCEIELDLVEGIPHDEVIERIRAADVAVDQLELGWYGGFAVECMALGTPVIAFLDPSQLAAVPPKLVEDLPILQASPNTLADTLVTCRDALQESASRSRSFVETWHSRKQLP